MTTNANYRCYACAKSGLALDDLRYECMCIDRVGACRACEKVPIAAWKIPFAPGHALRRRPDDHRLEILEAGNEPARADHQLPGQ